VRRLRQVIGGRTPIARNEESWSASLQVLWQGLNTCSDAITPYVAKSLYCPFGLISKVRIIHRPPHFMFVLAQRHDDRQPSLA
jgi:hypothetical protein